MRGLLFALSALILSSGANAQSPQMALRSDLPLWADIRDGRIWPQHIERSVGPDIEIGCRSKMALGDWTGRLFDANWTRFTSGAIHCYLGEARSGDREGLDQASNRLSFLVDLGSARGPDGDVKLWALQSGLTAGSDYVLLVSRPDVGVIKAFDILEMNCPRGMIRRGPRVDIVGTDYCVARSQRELINLARRMARLPAVGTFVYVPAPPPTEEELAACDRRGVPAECREALLNRAHP